MCLPNPTSSLLTCPGTASAAMVSSSSREHSVDDFLVQGPVSSSNGRRQLTNMKICCCRQCRCLKGRDDCFVELVGNEQNIEAFIVSNPMLLE